MISDIKIEFVQSNIEGEIVTWIQGAKDTQDGIIINAAGFTHTSVAIRDALHIFDKVKIELHISNIYKREEFRQKSMEIPVEQWIDTPDSKVPFSYAFSLWFDLIKIYKEYR